MPIGRLHNNERWGMQKDEWSERAPLIRPPRFEDFRYRCKHLGYSRSSWWNHFLLNAFCSGAGWSNRIPKRYPSCFKTVQRDRTCWIIDRVIGCQLPQLSIRAALLNCFRGNVSLLQLSIQRGSFESIRTCISKWWFAGAGMSSWAPTFSSCVWPTGTP